MALPAATVTRNATPASALDMNVTAPNDGLDEGVGESDTVLEKLGVMLGVGVPDPEFDGVAVPDGVLEGVVVPVTLCVPVTLGVCVALVPAEGVVEGVAAGVPGLLAPGLKDAEGVADGVLEAGTVREDVGVGLGELVSDAVGVAELVGVVVGLTELVGEGVPLPVTDAVGDMLVVVDPDKVVEAVGVLVALTVLVADAVATPETAALLVADVDDEGEGRSEGGTVTRAEGLEDGDAELLLELDALRVPVPLVVDDSVVLLLTTPLSEAVFDAVPLETADDVNEPVGCCVDVKEPVGDAELLGDRGIERDAAALRDEDTDGVAVTVALVLREIKGDLEDDRVAEVQVLGLGLAVLESEGRGERLLVRVTLGEGLSETWMLEDSERCALRELLIEPVTVPHVDATTVTVALRGDEALAEGLLNAEALAIEADALGDALRESVAVEVAEVHGLARTDLDKEEERLADGDLEELREESADGDKRPVLDSEPVAEGETVVLPDEHWLRVEVSEAVPCATVAEICVAGMLADGETETLADEVLLGLDVVVRDTLVDAVPDALRDGDTVSVNVLLDRAELEGVALVVLDKDDVVEGRADALAELAADADDASDSEETREEEAVSDVPAEGDWPEDDDTRGDDEADALRDDEGECVGRTETDRDTAAERDTNALTLSDGDALVERLARDDALDEGLAVGLREACDVRLAEFVTEPEDAEDAVERLERCALELAVSLNESVGRVLAEEDRDDEGDDVGVLVAELDTDGKGERLEDTELVEDTDAVTVLNEFAVRRLEGETVEAPDAEAGSDGSAVAVSAVLTVAASDPVPLEEVAELDDVKDDDAEGDMEAETAPLLDDDDDTLPTDAVGVPEASADAVAGTESEPEAEGCAVVVTRMDTDGSLLTIDVGDTLGSDVV